MSPSSRPRVRRRRSNRLGQSLTFAALVAALAASSACRNRRQTLAPVRVDPAEAGELRESDRRYAPVWTEVERAVLSNGLLVHRLEETASPRVHLRLLVPTDGAEGVSASARAVLLGLLERNLQTKLRQSGVQVRISSGPGRVELSMSGAATDVPRMIGALQFALSTETNPSVVERALEAEYARTEPLDPDAAAATFLLSKLLDLPIDRLLVSQAQLAKETPASIKRAAKDIFDPRRCVLLVHLPAGDEESRGQLDALAESWRNPAPRLRAPPKTAGARLQLDLGEVEATEHIAASPAATLWSLDGDAVYGARDAYLVVARRVYLPTAESRAMARLAHRLLQQEIDANLLISGSTGILLARHRLNREKPVDGIERFLEDFERAARTTRRVEQMQHAARLWLGARVVAASLAHEDWTGLWAEAIDIGASEESLGAALALDAGTMLQATPEDLQAFSAKWFAPRGGTGGWSWAVAGASAETRKALAAKFPLELETLD